MAAGGRVPGQTSTDGVSVAGESLAQGDYAGPEGARLLLRDRRVETAILETARGGILRRGLAVERADVAVVTNIAEDHFGEFGVFDCAGSGRRQAGRGAGDPALGPGGAQRR